MKIIIAPDSFKGSLTAKEATNAIKKGVTNILPDAQIEEIPLADGGDGTMEVLVLSTNGQIKKTKALDPLCREIIAPYGILGDGKTAIIEMAAISGLKLLKNGELNPLMTTTFGTGQLIKKALDDGFRRLIICVGGSATNDCGSGMAQAIGVKFLNKYGTEIKQKMCGDLLGHVTSIQLSNLPTCINECEIIVASDVDNPLLGKKGCASIYSPQKGATNDMVEQLEINMTSFINISENATKLSVRDIPGAGAAGGLGAGLMMFLKAELKSGIDIVLDACDFRERIRNADLILTGEGKIDSQTVYGKTIFGVVREAELQKVPIIAFVGIAERSGNLDKMGISNIYSICPNNVPIEQSMKHASTFLKNTVERVMQKYWIQ